MNEKPICFDKCSIPGCDMVEDHCGNNEWPPMSRCAKCEFWFTNLEKKRDKERLNKCKD
jgi:hypothetical protein